MVPAAFVLLSLAQPQLRSAAGEDFELPINLYVAKYIEFYQKDMFSLPMKAFLGHAAALCCHLLP